MSRTLFAPATTRRSIPPVPGEAPALEAPLKQEMETPKTAMMKLMPIIMLGVVGLMLVVMMSMRAGGASGGAMAAVGGGGMLMMLPMVLMMGMSAFQRSGNQSEANDDANLAKGRKTNDLTQARMRDRAHAIGAAMHLTLTRTFPNVTAMPTMIDARHDTLWSVTPDNADRYTDTTTDPSDTSLPKYPMLGARIGVGAVPLAPGINTEAVSDLPEAIDPVTLKSNVDFLAVHSQVREAPLHVGLLTAPAFGMVGPNHAGRYQLARTMLCSVAYSHAPSVAHIGVIAAPDAMPNWEWCKWLPHNANTFVDPGEQGHGTLFWTDMASAVRDLIRYQATIAAENSHLVIVIDLPDQETCIPADLINSPEYASVFSTGDDGTRGIENVTFLNVHGYDDGLTSLTTRFRITQDNHITFYGLGDTVVRGDKTTIADAERVARHLSGIQDPAFGRSYNLDAGTEIIVDDIDAPTALDAVGTRDLDNFDLLRNWEAADNDEHFRAPVGFVVDKKNKPTGELAYLDILQHVSGGSGPHGLFSGSTGTGKSFLIQWIILIWCLKFSPRKINFILADFKGAATFAKFSRFPHVLAVLSNLNGATDMLNRTRDVLAGERAWRENLLATYGCEDYLTYHAKQKAHPELNMPDMPVLVFVADEYRELIKAHGRDYVDMFASIAAVGRSLGMNLFLGSQFLDQSLLGDSSEQMTYGITLKVETPQRSAAVIGNGDGSSLPRSRVALMRTIDGQEDVITRLQGFNHKLPYIPTDDHPTAMIANGGLDTGESRHSGPHRVSLFTALGSPAAEAAVAGVTPEKAPDTRKAESAAEHDDTGATIDHFTAISNLILEKSANYPAPRQLWTEPMSTPMSMFDLPEGYWDLDDDNGSLRIGDIDVPFEHRRKPLTVNIVTNGTIDVIGDRGTGRSMALRAMIAASTMRYAGNYITWLVLEHNDTSLEDVTPWPNVSTYATSNDTDMWMRMRGEIDRILAIRQAAWAEHRPRNVDEYITRRAEWGITNDPYGHLVLAVDNLGRLLESLKEEDPDGIVDWVRRTAAVIGTYGIHMVATRSAGDGFKASQILGHFDHHLLLRTSDVGSVPQEMTGPELRGIMPTVPSDSTGRVLDNSTVNADGTTLWLHGRIMVPVPREIEPESVSDNGVKKYAARMDYSDQIQEFGAQMTAHQAASNVLAPKITAPRGTISFHEMWDKAVAEIDNTGAPHTRTIPLGVALNTGTAVGHALSSTAPGHARHLLITGGAGKGATTILRTYLTSLVSTYTPREARVMIFDGGSGLFKMSKTLVDRGYMNDASYTFDPDEAAEMVNKLEAIIERRMPTREQLNADPDSLETRSYLPEGTPEIFVIVDKYPMFKKNGTGAGTLEGLMEKMGSGVDIGVHFIVTEPDSAMSMDSMSSKFISGLLGPQKAGVLLMSSTEGGQIAYGKRFTTLPTGRVRMISPGSGAVSHVQIASSGTR